MSWTTSMSTPVSTVMPTDFSVSSNSTTSIVPPPLRSNRSNTSLNAEMMQLPRSEYVWQAFKKMRFFHASRCDYGCWKVHLSIEDMKNDIYWYCDILLKWADFLSRAQKFLQFLTCFSSQTRWNHKSKYYGNLGAEILHKFCLQYEWWI